MNPLNGRLHRLALWLPFAAALAACARERDVVTWSARRDVAAPTVPTVLAADGSFVPDTLMALAARVSPPPAPYCAGSLRLARSGATLYGVWWSPRPDSGARLLAARSGDQGRSWSTPSVVDTLDRAVSGCRREGPSIAADAASGYVHVAYALQAPEGPGLFFSHSMDDGATFHSPVPIVYGERLGRTSVASSGDVVVVAFEDPNSRNPQIGIALSRTMGHIFEQRLLPLSDENGIASHPLAAVSGRHIAVAWEQRAVANGPAALTVRVGAVD